MLVLLLDGSYIAYSQHSDSIENYACSFPNYVMEDGGAVVVHQPIVPKVPDLNYVVSGFCLCEFFKLTSPV